MLKLVSENSKCRKCHIDKSITGETRLERQTKSIPIEMYI